MSHAASTQGRAGQGGGDPCDRCYECGLRCTAGVQMTRAEYDGILAHLRTEDPRLVARVLEQDKTVVWFEEIETEACLFYDVPKRQCIVYPARPLICRLFGHVEWLPCPARKRLPQIHDAVKLIQLYADEKRATFVEWCSELGIFDLNQLAAGPR